MLHDPGPFAAGVLSILSGCALYHLIGPAPPASPAPIAHAVTLDTPGVKSAPVHVPGPNATATAWPAWLQGGAALCVAGVAGLAGASLGRQRRPAPLADLAPSFGAAADAHLTEPRHGPHHDASPSPRRRSRAPRQGSVGDSSVLSALAAAEHRR